jgi:diguanylate cyclase (GGDEF)-like protein
LIRLPGPGAALAGLDLGPVLWSSRSLVMIGDASGTMIDANPSFEKLAGTMVGTPITDLVGTRQRPAFRAWLHAVGDAWETRAWGIFPDADGVPRDFRIAACRSVSGEIVLLAEPLLTDDLTAGLLDVNESLVVEHRRLDRERGRLDRETRLDSLTGLANRRAFESRLVDEMHRAAGGGTFAVVMIDIDRFKSVNDRLGHATGDAVLRWLGDRLRSAARRGDFIARYGGEEFIAILRDAGPADAAAWAERLRQVIRAVPPPGMEGAVTASLGVAGWTRGETGQAVVERADRGLYLAKNAGRDRVVTAEDEPL